MDTWFLGMMKVNEDPMNPTCSHGGSWGAWVYEMGWFSWVPAS
jgi:hypothetical protein